MISGERNEFLTSMGHELRNPLTSIVAHAEALFEGVYGPVADAQKTALLSIQDSVRHMLDLVADVVDLSKIEAAAPPLNPIACSVGETVRYCLERVAELARSRSTRLVSEIHPHDFSVMADARRLRQMIAELLAAAILTAPTGSQVQLCVLPDGDGLLVQTQSNSSQPAPAHTLADEADAMLSPVLRQLRKLKPIGIALLHQLVRLHSGSFTVHETAAHAVSMSIRLPLNLLSDAEEKQAGELPATPLTVDTPRTSTPSAHPPTILLADDQAALVTVTRNYLESIGFHVQTARDGREAVHLAFTLQPDLIMMDVQMPVMDGLKAIRHIRESPDAKIRDIPIISLSGLAGAGDKEKCLAAGATAYLSKPFGVRELARVLADFIQPPPC